MSDVEANSVQRVCLSTSRPWWRLHLSTIALTLLAADVLATLIVPADYWAGSGIRHRFEYGWPWHYATAISNEDEPSLQGYFGPMTDRAPWMLPRLWWVGKNATWHPRALAVDLGLGLAITATLATVLEWRRRRRRSFWQFTTKDLFAVTLVAALVVGWFARAKHQRDAEHLALEQLAPWQRTLPGSTPTADRFMFYAGPDWLRRLLPPTAAPGSTGPAAWTSDRRPTIPQGRSPSQHSRTFTAFKA